MEYNVIKKLINYLKKIAQSNMRLLTITQLRELSHQPKSNFESRRYG